MQPLIYKISPKREWDQAVSKGTYSGAPIDLQDGFIHFSTKEQVDETAAKHFAGQDNLLLIAIDTSHFGDELKWEISRGGALFPHLYAELDLETVVWARPMPLDENGRHQLSFDEAE